MMKLPTYVTDLRVTSLLSLAIAYRWALALFPYSGKGVAPLYGDYEAQRHWQEVTTNLPVNEWYKNTTNNDLLYWGLDYPPLTAYHSFVVGSIASNVNSSWIAMPESRGIEGYTHKLFMRYSVLISDMLIYYPSVIFYSFQQKEIHVGTVMAALLFYPGIALIDYGHFQYNGVSLGLFIFAVSLLQKKQILYGAVLFSLALNYKQMELYHAIPFFVYILSHCLTMGNEYRIVKLCKVAVVTILSFAICWLPFMWKGEDALAVIQRLFPFSRGLFEDKVANAWCTLSIILKIKSLLNPEKIIQLCALTTLLSVLPSSIKLFMKPSIKNFKFALVISSLSFFLFSYQVHEKSILIPAVSALLLLEKTEVSVNGAFAAVSTFSMLPLLIKDGLLMALILSTVIYLIIMYLLNCESYTILQLALMTLSLIGMVTLTLLSALIQPPQRYPDLWPVLVSAYSFGHFIFFLAYYNYKLFTN